MFFRPNEDVPHEFDYVYLMNRLSGYSNPWGAVRRMLKAGEIVRVKKGIYVPGKEYGRSFSSLILANVMFGPSYVSFASALSYYDLVSDAPAAVWSVTPARKKIFATPLGNFEYYFQSLKLFAAGMARVPIEGDRYALVATPEKALFDFVAFRLRHSAQIEIPLRDILIEDLRVDESSLRKLSVGRLEELGRLGGSKLGFDIADCIRSLR